MARTVDFGYNMLSLGFTRLSLIYSHYNRLQRFYVHKTR